MLILYYKDIENINIISIGQQLKVIKVKNILVGSILDMKEKYIEHMHYWVITNKRNIISSQEITCITSTKIRKFNIPLYYLNWKIQYTSFCLYHSFDNPTFLFFCIIFIRRIHFVSDQMLYLKIEHMIIVVLFPLEFL